MELNPKQENMLRKAKEQRIYYSCMTTCFQDFHMEMTLEEKDCLLKCNDRKHEFLTKNYTQFQNMILKNLE